ncbi:MAG: xanthine dehydrogenase molybdopterin binding subunit [Planctomycetota bacterium]
MLRRDERSKQELAQSGSRSVGKAMPHDSAKGHVTGSATYVEDLLPLANELWVHFAGSPVAHGVIRSVDAGAALQMPAVVGVYTHEDLGGLNVFGSIIHDEPFLAEGTVHYVGQPVVVVAATDRDAARRAAESVVIDVEELTPVLEIEEAIRADAFIGPLRTIKAGDPDAAMATCPHVIQGTFRNNGQEQFYFESQACQAVPDEFGTLRLTSSTQHPTEIQAFVAEVLGLQMHQVVCECKRMGGAFGGKESQSAIPALMTALVAQKTGRPARVVYDKHTDMCVTGKRHPYVNQYEVGFDDSGRIHAAKFKLFSNGGAFADLSTAVLERSMMHADNTFHLPNVEIQGRVCRTNIPPNTAFRGFGGPQGVVTMENAIEEIANHLGLDSLDVRKANLYRDGDPDRNQTPYGQIVENHVLEETFDELEQSSDYRRRATEIDAFNQSQDLLVKGIALSGIKFGISFTSKFLNQGNALVNVYLDGSVQVSTGGTEMGQGLNTKIQQLVADEFGIAFESVRLMTTSTEKNNNTSPTAASAGTDLNGTAAVMACEQIKARMAKFAVQWFAQQCPGQSSPTESDIQFQDAMVFDSRADSQSEPMAFTAFCDLARRARVDLGQRAFYATPVVEFDRDTGKGAPFFYYTNGASVAEVTIDRLTGEMVVDRLDLLMDIGQMINPGIDRGQVIGGYIQGMGWCTNEELVYDASGSLLSTGPTTYKIPNITDLPPVMNVNFINNPKHDRNVRLSKAVGEPPLMLGIAPWLAAKRALASLGDVSGGKLKLPATSEELLMCMESLSTAETPAVP